ncbi:hypothetical protein C8R46DRAFT_941049 [Mycena filopes]|nr:hypothetical protein C8R46DRAFT_941049 [Mycena filopes]
MPHPQTAAETRINNITACLNPALTLLKELNDAFGPPFMQPIINTTQALMTGVQNVKRNKDECFQMVESLPQVLYSIIHLHLKSETSGGLPLAVFQDIGEFAEILHKIYMFVQLQQDGNRIKQLFHQSEANRLLKDCRTRLDQAIAIFKGQTGVQVFNDIVQLQTEADNMHKELLELISTVSDGTISESSSSVLYEASNNSQKSSNSFLLLPPKPQIFHGRQSELKHVLDILGGNAPRIAILGAGGMGKTSLAKAALHHSETCSKFQARFFVSAEAATTAVELAALIGLHLGQEPGPNPAKLVVQYFAQQTSPCILVLDNLETPWEPLQSRSAVEEFLSLLADVNQLALIITMRGAERPSKVQWTRPFLLPLEPLSDNAALQIFEDITDDPDLPHEKHQLLQFTENIPLALDLMAHLVDYEGLSNVLARWRTEKTSLLSVGDDRTSNMDASIALSLSSPRLTSGSRELLSLLSILPDGPSEVELIQSNLPIDDVLSCKSVLMATSLAYKDTKGRLRSLVPIRAHVHHFSPPSQALVLAFRKSFHALLAVYQKYNDSRLSSILPHITANLANMEEVLHWGLQPSSLDVAESIQSTLSLNSFYRVTRDSGTPLFHNIPIHLCDAQLKVVHIIECLRGSHSKINPHELVAQGICHLQHFHNPVLESTFYLVAGRSSGRSGLRVQEIQFTDRALALSKSAEDGLAAQCDCLIAMAYIMWRKGDYTAALAFARDSRQLAYQTTNLYQASRALDIYAQCLSSLGDYPAAMINLHEAREVQIICGMTSSRLHHMSSSSQAEVHLCKSEYAEARSIHAAILQDLLLDPNSDSYVITLLNITQIDIIIGAQTELVHQNLATIYKTCTSTRYHRALSWHELFAAHLDLREGNPTSARAVFQDCLKSNLGKDSDVIIYCLEQLADVAQWPTEFHGQSKWPVLYLCQTHKIKDRLGLSKALLFTADLYLEDNEVTAQSLLTVALEQFTFMDVHRSRAQCMMQLGDLAHKQGRPIEAADLWRSARPLFEQPFQTKDVAHIDDRLSALEQESLAKLTTLHTPMTLLADNSIEGIPDIQGGNNTPQREHEHKVMPI